MKKTAFQRSISAYVFSLMLTVIFCMLLTGIVYLDICSRNTLLSAKGLIYPIFDRLVDIIENWY